MATNKKELLPAPSGQDSTSDPTKLQVNRAQAVNNALVDRVGILRGQIQLIDLLPFPTYAPIDGLCYYSGTPYPYQDRVIFAMGGWLWETCYAGVDFYSDDVPANFQPPYPPTLQCYLGQTVPPVQSYNQNIIDYWPELSSTPSTPASIGPGFAPLVVGNRARGVMQGQELIIAGNNTINPMPPTAEIPEANYIYVGNSNFATSQGICLTGNLFPLGLYPPLATVIHGLTASSLTPPAGKNAGTFYYRSAYTDYLGRVSELSPLYGSDGVTIIAPTITISDNQVVNMSITAMPQNPYLQGINLYVNTDGELTEWYNFASFTASSLVGGGSAQDANNDITVAGFPTGPNPGQNTIANPASCVAQYRDRIILNQINAPSTISISGSDNPVQYSQVNYLPTDGLIIQIDENFGQPVIGFATLGTILLIFRLNSVYMLLGSTAADFAVRQIVSIKGSISADSIVQCLNYVYFGTDDGVYSIDVNLNVTKVSYELDRNIQTYQYTPLGRELLSQSLGWFVNNEYSLHINYTTFVYNFNVGGWATRTFGNITPNGAFGTGLTHGIQPAIIQIGAAEYG